MEVRDPVTGPYMLGRVDGDLLRSAPASAQTVLILGDYRWDGNPYIGTWPDTVSSIIIIPLKARWPTSMCGTAPWRRRSSGRRPAAARPWRTRAASSTTGAEIFRQGRQRREWESDKGRVVQCSQLFWSAHN